MADFLWNNFETLINLQLISSRMLSTLSVSLMSGFEARQTSSRLMCSIFGHKLKMLTVVFPSLDVCNNKNILEINFIIILQETFVQIDLILIWVFIMTWFKLIFAARRGEHKTKKLGVTSSLDYW